VVNRGGAPSWAYGNDAADDDVVAARGITEMNVSRDTFYLIDMKARGPW